MNRKMRGFKRRLINLQVKLYELGTEMHQHILDQPPSKNMAEENQVFLQVHLASTQLAIASHMPAMKE